MDPGPSALTRCPRGRRGPRRSDTVGGEAAGKLARSGPSPSWGATAAGARRCVDRGPQRIPTAGTRLPSSGGLPSRSSRQCWPSLASCWRSSPTASASCAGWWPWSVGSSPWAVSAAGRPRGVGSRSWGPALVCSRWSRCCYDTGHRRRTGVGDDHEPASSDLGRGAGRGGCADDDGGACADDDHGPVVGLRDERPCARRELERRDSGCALLNDRPDLRSPNRRGTRQPAGRVRYRFGSGNPRPRGRRPDRPTHRVGPGRRTGRSAPRPTWPSTPTPTEPTTCWVRPCVEIVKQRRPVLCRHGWETEASRTGMPPSKRSGPSMGRDQRHRPFGAGACSPATTVDSGNQPGTARPTPAVHIARSGSAGPVGPAEPGQRRPNPPSRMRRCSP